MESTEIADQTAAVPRVGVRPTPPYRRGIPKGHPLSSMRGLFDEMVDTATTEARDDGNRPIALRALFLQALYGIGRPPR